MSLTSANIGLQWGYGSAGKSLDPFQIEEVLNIKKYFAGVGFVSDRINKAKLTYYPYGSYFLEYEGYAPGTTQFSPIFIKTNNGGWLDLGQEHPKLTPTNKEIAHDLVMFLLHRPWDSIWFSNGWEFDSALNARPYENKISITSVPANLAKGRYELRFLITGFDNKEGKFLTEAITERITS